MHGALVKRLVLVICHVSKEGGRRPDDLLSQQRSARARELLERALPDEGLAGAAAVAAKDEGELNWVVLGILLVRINEWVRPVLPGLAQAWLDRCVARITDPDDACAVDPTTINVRVHSWPEKNPFTIFFSTWS